MKPIRQSGIPDPYAVDGAAGWKVIDASTLARRPQLDADVAIVGSGAGGGSGRDPRHAGLDGGRAGGRPAEDVRRFPDARVRGLPGPVPGIGGAQDARQGDQHSPGPLRGRRHDGQLDRVPSARRRPRSRSGGANTGSTGFGVDDWRRGSRKWRRGCRSSVGSRAQREQRGARARRRKRIGIPASSIRRNVVGCWNLGYCGMGARSMPSSRCWSQRFPPRSNGRHARHARARAATSCWPAAA